VRGAVGNGECGLAEFEIPKTKIRVLSNGTIGGSVARKSTAGFLVALGVVPRLFRY